MLDLTEINNAISDLESGATNFANCEKLAHLYSVRDHLQSDSVEKEYSDILPSYQTYKECKIKYQQNECSKEKLMETVRLLAQEVYEFIATLYASADTEEEKDEILKTVRRLIEG